MFSLIQTNHKECLQNIAKQINNVNISETAYNLQQLFEDIRAAIPEKKRISYGGYSVIKEMGKEILPFIPKEIDILEFSKAIYLNTEYNQFIRSLGIQLISVFAEFHGNLEIVLPVFEEAAQDNDWIIRECSAGFIRKLIKKYPTELKIWYLKMVQSQNPMQRRFACESLRPVADNGWFRKHTEFVFPIIENLYHESSPYPRTSIGNTLSDWMRINEKMTLEIIEKLAANGDKNSYWIAYRACRNLVKKEPEKVMKLLNVKEYKYKDREYKI